MILDGGRTGFLVGGLFCAGARRSFDRVEKEHLAWLITMDLFLWSWMNGDLDFMQAPEADKPDLDRLADDGCPHEEPEHEPEHEHDIGGES